MTIDMSHIAQSSLFYMPNGTVQTRKRSVYDANNTVYPTNPSVYDVPCAV